MELSCKKCGFSWHVEGKKQPPRDSRRIKPLFYVEALTKDEVLAQMEEKERAKEKELKEKREWQRNRREKVQQKRNPQPRARKC